MDQDAPFPSPPEPVRAPRRRTPVVVASVAAAVLTLAGGGAGYVVAVQQRASTTGTQPPGTSQQLSSSDGYGYGYGYGDQADDGFGGGQLGGGFGGQLPSAPEGAGTGTSTDTSTDASGTASGSQLTGLVRIVSTMEYADGKAAGTGMVLTSDGEVVTNHHVVAGATKITATVMATGRTYTAEVVGTDATADVAVLRLEDASGLATITPDDDTVSVGDAVTAVGDGKGTVDHLSTATGSVIATGRTITTQSEAAATGERLSDLIEISSDVVGGYSGGATYDAEGEVLGMTTAASGGSRDVVGYAIPMSTVLDIVGDLGSGVQSGAYTYGYPAFLGIGLPDGTAPTVAGVYDGTPADDAGITAGDTITRVGSTAVSTADELQAAIAAHEPGDSVRVTWKDADGSVHSATVTLAQGPVK